MSRNFWIILYLTIASACCAEHWVPTFDLRDLRSEVICRDFILRVSLTDIEHRKLSVEFVVLDDRVVVRTYQGEQLLQESSGAKVSIGMIQQWRRDLLSEELVKSSSEAQADPDREIRYDWYLDITCGSLTYRDIRFSHAFGDADPVLRIGRQMLSKAGFTKRRFHALVPPSEFSWRPPGPLFSD